MQTKAPVDERLTYSIPVRADAYRPVALEISGITDEYLAKYKLSMLSKPSKVEAIIPDFSRTDSELASLGLIREQDGWHIDGPNREWFPSPLTEDSIVVGYGTKADGTPDIGFCSQQEFGSIYADTAEYDAGEIAYIDPASRDKMVTIAATKHAVGEFAIVPPGTLVHTNEGDVVAADGQVLVINERSSSVYLSDIKEVLKRYVADPMSPASSEVFDKLLSYSSDTSVGFESVTDAFFSADRDKKAYTGDSVENLHESFRKSAELVDTLSAEVGSSINALSFSGRIEQAKSMLHDTASNPEFSREQMLNRVVYIMARLLPKTNNHQHLKGSVPKATILELATQHGFNTDDINSIETAYSMGAAGFKDLNEFNDSYGAIGRAIRTPSDYQRAVQSIMTEATRSGQVSVEVRCSVIGQRDENGEPLAPEAATENLLAAMDATRAELADDAPATSLVFLGYRGRDWKPEEVTEHARLAVKFATKYPTKKFGFDIAGPEDTGYGPAYFQEAYQLIRDYNNAIATGEIAGETIGVTTHAGETPTFDDGRPGQESVEEALAMGAVRVGHGIQSVLSQGTLDTLKASGATVEICGVCNITSIPVNTRGMAIHPIQQFISRNIPVTICTDNDAICGTDITKEYAQFLFSGHSEVMNWKTVKQIAAQGIESSFITSAEKAKALNQFGRQVRIIERITESAIAEINHTQMARDGASALIAIDHLAAGQTDARTS